MRERWAKLGRLVGRLGVVVVARISLAIFFVVAGVNHFVSPSTYLAIMPPYMPMHEALVAVSGLLEIGGGLAVLSRRYRRAAGWILTFLLVGIFPANIHMAMNPDLFPTIPAWALYARLPLQGLLIAWALWATRESVDGPASERR